MLAFECDQCDQCEKFDEGHPPFAINDLTQERRP
ncbi:hypothetical protein BH10ACT8_BH10ACT8_32160 [soil metagenome]|jgi:hypothetical protein